MLGVGSWPGIAEPAAGAGFLGGGCGLRGLLPVGFRRVLPSLSGSRTGAPKKRAMRVDAHAEEA